MKVTLEAQGLHLKKTLENVYAREVLEDFMDEVCKSGKVADGDTVRVKATYDDDTEDEEFDVTCEQAWLYDYVELGDKE